MNKQIILALLLSLAMFGLAHGDEATPNNGVNSPPATVLSGEQLKWQVVSSSGGTATGGGFTLSSSLGQTSVGKGAGGSFKLIQGFLQNFGTAVVPCTSCGDADGNGSINISDAVFLIAYIFAGGSTPGDCNIPLGLGDANGNGAVNISDAVYLIAYIFAGGAAPHC
jgi:hypothetical protein